MSATAGLLRELHRIHQQLSDLRERLDRGPRQIKAREANAAKIEAELNQFKTESKAAKVAADQKQLLLRSGENKISELKVKLNAANSNREYQALKDQIAADEMANSVLADEILEGLEKIDVIGKQIKEVDERLAKAKEEVAKMQQTVRDQQGLLMGDVKRLEVDLGETEKRLPADFRDAYQRLVKGKGADALAVVEGETCSGCSQRITANIFSGLLMDHVVCCQACGRMLYLPEDRSPGKPAS